MKPANFVRGFLLCALVPLLSAACEDGKPSAIDAAESAKAAKSAEDQAKQDALAKLIEKNAQEREEKAAAEDPAKDISCKDGPVADFHDLELEAEVRRRLEKPEGDIKLSELAKIKALNLARAGVSVDYLDPCIFPHLTGLRDLFLGPGKLSDISLLAKLENLEALRASMNQISDVSPLSGLTKLDRLDLGRTQVKDVKPLSGLSNLTEVMLDNTKVTDIAPLASLDKLKVLSISGAPVENPTAISRPGLKVVDE
jgi:internalin A